MTTIAEALADAVQSARKAKEHRIRHRIDVPVAMLVGFRGDVPVAMIGPREMDRDVILAAARVAATGMCLDVLSLAFEVYVSTGHTEEDVRINPFTGKPWRPGDMQKLAQSGADVKEVLDEGIAAMVYNRAGDAAFTTLPFRISPAGDEIQWLPEMDGGEIGGLMHDELTAVMQEQVLSQKREWMLASQNMDSETMFAIGDVSAAKVLQATCEVALHAEPGTVRAGVLERSGIWTHKGRRT